ncbi:MAG: peptidylprolyl isomerase [Gemmobacter sp.]|nr:peptidylprolyl isomerase [Gemmobacter sp.]
MDAARRAIADKVEAVDDLLAGGATLQDLAQEQGMELGTLDFTDQSDEKIAGYPAFRAAAQQVQEGDFPEAVLLADGGLVALQLDEIVPATPIPLDEARADVEASWRRRPWQRRLPPGPRDQSGGRGAAPRWAPLALSRDRPISPATALWRACLPAPVAAAFEMAAGRCAVIDGAGFVGLRAAG